ncbi:hypothetical protein BJV38_000918 [Clostridium beijerinckii]|nr:hypothetical protein [Clostridium beijerinckii]NRT44075.1 hypothetical protein [Clostridium beijerinckii]NRZ21931.1 hypothetical protein [Clostridium beijerinckii]
MINLKDEKVLSLNIDKVNYTVNKRKIYKK